MTRELNAMDFTEHSAYMACSLSQIVGMACTEYELGWIWKKTAVLNF